MLNHVPPPTGMSRRQFLKFAGGAGLAMAVCGCPALVRPRPKTHNVIMLGIDGMDPSLLRGLIAKGRMPNFRRLAESGCFVPLGTSDPPQSPVAWSNVISGTNPGGHGIFDFIARDPATLKPYFSTAHVGPPHHALKLGRHSIPFGAPDVTNLRKGPTFWVDLEAQGVDCSVLRMPANFPPTPCGSRTLSGLGTPDIEGTYGMFTVYTDDLSMPQGELPGGRIERITPVNGRAEACLHGPALPEGGAHEFSALPLRLYPDRAAKAVKVVIENREWVLREGEWTDWIRLRFPMPGATPDVAGMVRMYLKHAGKQLVLYISPVNIDPLEPALPISTPSGFSNELARRLGPFYTQGIAEETRARSTGVFDDDDYRHQALLVHGDAVRLLEYELGRFKSGYFFGYLSVLDTCSHMFWRTMDPQHPLYTPELAAKHGDFLPWLYEQMDEFIGKILKRVDERTIFMVMSDHGFGTFRRQFNLNSWLMDYGYSTPTPGASRGSEALFADVDWRTTRAYGLGINGLYLNLKGRERDGIIQSGKDADQLTDELIHHLTGIRDPDTGTAVISRVCRARDIYSGPHMGNAPDLVVCYAPGYRASWDTVLGKYPQEHILDNLDPWSGDHSMDSSHLQGVFLSNRPITTTKPALEDIAPTLLSLFGASHNPAMTGRIIMDGGDPERKQAKESTHV